MNGSGAVVNRFSRGVGHLIHSYHHGFYLFNVRTDVVQRVDSNGNILHTYRYDAFGNQLNGSETNTNPFRFAAEYYDFETGFIYLRARFYNPLTGRMLSEDPHWTIHNMVFGDVHIMRHDRMVPNSLAIMQAGNLFVFATNNPVRFVDPSGLFVVDAVRDFGRGTWDGFVGHYQGMWQAITNPVDTVVGIGQAFRDDPLGMYLQTTILSPMNPIFGPHVIAHQITTAGGPYETGLVVGGYLGQASTIAVGYGVGKGVGAVAGRTAAVSKPWGSVDNLIRSATAPGRGGVTPIGRAFQKHNSRPGTAWTGQASGNAAQNTQQGMEHLNRILNDPNSTFVVSNHSVHGSVLSVRTSSGQGAMWSADGNRFIQVLERFTRGGSSSQ